MRHIPLRSFEVNVLPHLFVLISYFYVFYIVYFAPYTKTTSFYTLVSSKYFVCNLYAYDSEKWPKYVKQLTPLAPSFISHIFLTRRRESVLGRLSCAINLPFFVCFKGKQRLGRATKVSSQGAADRTKGRLSWILNSFVSFLFLFLFFFFFFFWKL